MSEQTTAAGTGSQSWISPDADAVQSGIDRDGGLGSDDARALGQELRVGQRVVTDDGQRVLVSQLLRDPQSHLITAFVVFTRPLFARELVVPLEWVVEVKGNRVSLNVDASELDKVPTYRAGEAKDPAVKRALWSDEDPRLSGRVLAWEALGRSE